MNMKGFIDKNLCFRAHFPNGVMKAKAISDEDMDLSITGSSCLVLNPCFQQKQGYFENFQIVLKLPMK